MTVYDDLSDIFFFILLRGHHVYKDIWTLFVSKTLAYQRALNNMTDPYSV